jgi:hypothetical protein
MPLSSNAGPAPSTVARSEAGFSVIEGLIASVLLLVVTLGILPLFSRSMSNNVKGNDSTRQATGATDSFETAISLPFNSGDMSVPAGETEVVVTDTIALKRYASPGGGEDQAISTRWELPADLNVGDVQVMNRQRTLRQYSFFDFVDDYSFNDPLDGVVQSRLVQFKVIDLTIQDASGLGAQPYQLRAVVAY